VLLAKEETFILTAIVLLLQPYIKGH